jgi:hypothetical protein
MVDTMGLKFPLLYVWQPSEMCERLNKPTLKSFDHNVYIKISQEENPVIALWSPADNEDCQIKISDPAELNALYEDFEAGSKFYNGYDGVLFSGVDPMNVEVSSEFEGHNVSADIPENVKAAAGWADVEDKFIGAK